MYLHIQGVAKERRQEHLTRFLTWK